MESTRQKPKTKKDIFIAVIQMGLRIQLSRSEKCELRGNAPTVPLLLAAGIT
jgi:hypothetical protein